MFITILQIASKICKISIHNILLKHEDSELESKDQVLKNNQKI